MIERVPADEVRQPTKAEILNKWESTTDATGVPLYEAHEDGSVSVGAEAPLRSDFRSPEEGFRRLMALIS